MTKWEYHAEEVPDTELVSGIWEKRLNEMGQEGWRLAIFSMDVSLGANSFATLERMVEEPLVVTEAFVMKIVEESLSKILKALETAPKVAEEGVEVQMSPTDTPPESRSSGIRAIVEDKEAPKKKARKEEVALQKGGDEAETFHSEA